MRARERPRTRPQRRAHPQRARRRRPTFTEARQEAEIANVTLRPSSSARDARNANAATFAGDLWIEASESFDSAARRLEDGDIRSARSAQRGRSAVSRCRAHAIKAQYLSQTRALLAEGASACAAHGAAHLEKRSPACRGRARLTRTSTTRTSAQLAQQANYEARHAIYLAGLIERLRGEDQSLEE